MMQSLKLLENYSIEAVRRIEIAPWVDPRLAPGVKHWRTEDDLIVCSVEDSGHNLIVMFDAEEKYWAAGWLHNIETGNVEPVKHKKLGEMANYMLQIIHDPMLRR